jgi:DNA polymerase-3 subunit delta
MSSSNASEVAPVVLVVGEEATLRDAAVAEVRERALGGAPAEFSEDRFDYSLGAVDPARIIGAAHMHPVMTERRLVWVRGVTDRRAGKFLDEVLVSYLDDPTPTTCLLLEATKVDKRQKWVKRVKQLGELIECTGPRKPAEVRRWIEQALSAAGKRPGAGASGALLEAVGPDVDLLQREIEKLCLYTGERREIEAEDVSAVTGHLRPRAVFELTDQIGARQLGAALETLGKLLDQGEAPLMILGALGNHFRRLIRARECRPLDPRTVQERLGVHQFVARKLADQARRYDLRRLRQCLDAVRRTDAALKGSVALTPRQAVERLVLAVCS